MEEEDIALITACHSIYFWVNVDTVVAYQNMA